MGTSGSRGAWNESESLDLIPSLFASPTVVSWAPNEDRCHPQKDLVASLDSHQPLRLRDLGPTINQPEGELEGGERAWFQRIRLGGPPRESYTISRSMMRSSSHDCGEIGGSGGMGGRRIRGSRSRSAVISEMRSRRSARMFSVSSTRPRTSSCFHLSRGCVEVGGGRGGET